MHMIDVMKRLAELDANNKNIVRENTNIEECGMMPMPGMSGSHTPASINMTADSGSELTGMLRDIMQLAGVHQVDHADLGFAPEPMSLTAEPVVAVGPAVAEPISSGEKMRSVLDKLNPESDDLGPFQGDGGEDDVSMSHGDFDNDGDHDMDDHDAEDDEETKKVDEYDNTPADPNSAEPFDANQFANQENQPGAGNDSGGRKRQSNLPSATFENLMKEYKSFIGESKAEMDETTEDNDMEEGIEDRLKDLDPKNPVNIPAYKRKAASGDSASAAKNTKESMNESIDILKLAGLRRL